MQRFYGLDATALFTGRLSVRRVMLLLTSLPADSSFISAVASQVDSPPSDDARERLWSTTDHLLAGLLDEQRVTNYIFAAIAGSKDAKPPTPLPRPGAPRRRRLTPEQRQMLDDWNLGRRADG